MNGDLKEIISAFIGSLGFAFLFNIRDKDLFWASFGGMLDWSVYTIAKNFTNNEYYNYFFAALFLGMYAQIIARKNLSPATMYLTVGFIPLIPGKALFMIMESLFKNNWISALTYALNAINIAIAIAGGIILEIVFTNIYNLYKNKKGEKNDLQM